MDALENLRSTPEAVAGYSAALTALIAGVSSSTLGIPHNRGKVICSALFIYSLNRECYVLNIPLIGNIQHIALFNIPLYSQLYAKN